MKQSDAKTIMEYYGGIGEMIWLLKCEKEDLESTNYNQLGAVAADGMPHATSPGKPVENKALDAAEKGVGERLREIADKVQILEGDAAAIRSCLDGVNSRYKRILSMRYLHRYSWGRIAVKIETPESTVRDWHRRGLNTMASALDHVDMTQEILGRASRARV